MYVGAESRDKNALAQEFLPMVKRIAYHMMTRLPASVEVDDLIQAGLMGLMDAVNRYDCDQGAHFETYATQRGATCRFLLSARLLRRAWLRMSRVLLRGGE